MKNKSNLKSNLTSYLQKVFQKGVSYFFCLSLLFWFSCSDSSSSTAPVVYSGSLINVSNIDENFANNAGITLTTTRVGSEDNHTNYLFLASQADNDLRVFSITKSNGNLTKVAQIDDNSDIELGKVTDIASTSLVTEIVSISGYVTNTTVTNGVDDSGMTKPFTNVTGVITNFVSSFFTTNYVFTAANGDNGISTFSINESGEVTHVSRIKQPTTELNGVRAITTAQVGDSTLLIAGARSGGISSGGEPIAVGYLSTFKVSSNGELSYLDSRNFVDAAQTAGGVREITSAKIGNNTYIFVYGLDVDEVRVHRVRENGRLSGDLDSAKDIDNEDYDLKGIESLATAQIGNNTYLFTAAKTDSSVSTFAVRGIDLEFVASINDNDNSIIGDDSNGDDSESVRLNLASVDGIITTKVGSSTYLLASSSADNGISMFNIADNGTLINVDNVNDDATYKLNNVGKSIITSEVGGITYLFAVGNNDGGISVFRVEAD